MMRKNNEKETKKQKKEHKNEDDDNASCRMSTEQVRHALTVLPDPPKFQIKEFSPNVKSNKRALRDYEEIWTFSDCNKINFLGIKNDTNQTLAKFCQSFLPSDSNFMKFDEPDSRIEPTIDIQDLRNHKQQNLFIHAAIKNRSDIIDKLFKYNFDIDHEDDVNLNVIDHLWINFINSKDISIENEILILLKANSKFPKENLGFEYEKTPDVVKKFIDTSEEMHQLIKNDYVRGIQKLLSRNNNLRYFYDRFNESAMFLALKKNQINSIEAIKDVLSINRSEKLSDIYGDLDLSIDCALSRHILVLNSRSIILNNTMASQECWKLINDAYNVLNKNEICSKILRIAATCEELFINFDFKDGNVCTKDKAADKTDGSAKINVNAKNLINSNKLATLCDFVQKLSHLVIKITFLDTNANIEPGKVTNPAHQGYKTTQDEKLNQVVKKVFKFYSKSNKNFDNFNYFKSADVKEVEKALKYLHDPENTVEYDDLIAPMKLRILSSKIIFQGQETTLNDMIGDDPNVLKFLTSENIQNILLRNEIIEIGELQQCENVIERKFIKIDVHNIEKDIKDHQNETFMLQTIKNLIFFEPIKQENLQTSSFNDHQPETLNYQQVISIEALKLFILIGSAGAGKSAAFGDLAVKLKKNFPNYWVGLVNIRKNFEVLEKYSNTGAELTAEDVINLFVEVFNIQSRFGIEIFKKMFKENKLILLIDEFDEIKADKLDFMIKIIKFLKNNQLWISTRHHHALKLSKSIKFDAIYNLYPMTQHENESLIKQTLMTHKSFELSTLDTEIPKDLINFIDFLEHNSHKINNPLTIEIITELYAENIIKLSQDSLNTYQALDAIYNRLETKFNDKIDLKLNWHQQRFSIDDIYQVYALKVMFGADYKDQLEDLAIMKNWKSEQRHWTEEEIESRGLLFVDLKDDENNVKFIHVSFAELFVSKFILSFLFDNYFGIKDEEFEKTINLLKFIANKRIYRNICNFLWDFIKNSDKNFHETVIKILKDGGNNESDPQSFLKSLFSN
ncbi:hypothetical protein ACKWTF_015461 [Chironomus riparius]